MDAILPKQTVAVIDIGSSAIRMVIAEVDSKAGIHYLENLQKPIAFGKEVFTSGRISHATIKEGIEILKNYKQMIETYGVKTVQVVATSAVREAANTDNFVDQVFVRTGFDVEVLDGAEENRLDLIAVEHALHDKFDFEKKNCLIVEVGSGSTEMIILNHGEVELTRVLSLGTSRLPEQVIAGKTETAQMQRILKRNIHEIVEYAGREYNLAELDSFIALGGEMRFTAKQLTEKAEHDFVVVENKPFLNFVASLVKLTPEEIVKKFGIPYESAETLYASLLCYAYFLGETKAENIIVPMVSIRDGLLLEMAQMLSGYKRTDVSKQVISSARRLGKKYKYDEPHASCVAALSVKLFDSLKEDHGLGSRERLLLEVSAILHDIGMYISPASHHKHSSYLIDAAEIFGLRKSDKGMVSSIVRYHRRSTPQLVHEPYMSLPKTDRAVVSKLAAILRVGDALDKSHQQRIRNFTFERNQDAWTLWVPEETGDITLERDALAKKGTMFNEIFGASLIVKQGTPPKS